MSLSLEAEVKFAKEEAEIWSWFCKPFSLWLMIYDRCLKDTFLKRLFLIVLFIILMPFMIAWPVGLIWPCLIVYELYKLIRWIVKGNHEKS